VGCGERGRLVGEVSAWLGEGSGGSSRKSERRSRGPRRACTAPGEVGEGGSGLQSEEVSSLTEEGEELGVGLPNGRVDCVSGVRGGEGGRADLAGRAVWRTEWLVTEARGAGAGAEWGARGGQ